MWANNESIEKNTCVNNNAFGISLDRSHNNDVLDNNLSENSNSSSVYHGVGLTFYRSSHNNCSRNEIFNNRVGIKIGSSSHNNSINLNFFRRNSDWGIEVSKYNHHTINANLNHWGDPSGPYHEELNPNGKGDTIDGNILFDPWLDQPVDKEDDLTFFYHLIGILVGLLILLFLVSFNIIEFNNRPLK